MDSCPSHDEVGGLNLDFARLDTHHTQVMALLACWFHDLRNQNHSPKFDQLMASLHRLPISFGMGLRLQEQCRRWAHRLVDAEHIFILGKGYAEPIAREGALKIKECAYVHAEGLSGGAMGCAVGVNEGPDDKELRLK